MTWLHDRLVIQGNHPDLYYPRFGTINWLRSLAILCNQPTLSDVNLKALYAAQTPRIVPSDAERDSIETEIFSCLFLSLQHLATLRELRKLPNSAAILARITIVNWYYGIYWAADAMLSAKDGAHPETHTKVANQWMSSIAKRGQGAVPLPEPFIFSAPTLVKAEYEAYIAANYGESRRQTDTHAVTVAHAKPNCVGALLGTATWHREKKEELIKLDLGITDFRKGAGGIAAQNKATRDQKLRRHGCCFLHQAYRARGKANYRDTLYFGYGDVHLPKLIQFGVDADQVLEKFLLMASCYAARKVRPASWTSFTQDVEQNSWFDTGLDNFFERAL